MGNALVSPGVWGGGFTSARFSPVKAPVRKAFFLGIILCVFQALDGVLTLVGVNRFGIDFEGNPFIRSLMEQFGHVPVLGLLKGLAVLMVIGLVFSAKRLPWVNNAMGALSCIYLIAAILPWTYILFVQPALM